MGFHLMHQLYTSVTLYVHLGPYGLVSITVTALLPQPPTHVRVQSLCAAQGSSVSPFGQ